MFLDSIVADKVIYATSDRITVATAAHEHARRVRSGHLFENSVPIAILVLRTNNPWLRTAGQYNETVAERDQLLLRCAEM